MELRSASGWGDLSLDINDVRYGRPFDEFTDLLVAVGHGEKRSFDGAWDEPGGRERFIGEVVSWGEAAEEVQGGKTRAFSSLRLRVGDRDIDIDSLPLKDQKLTEGAITLVEAAIRRAFCRHSRLTHAHGLRPGEGRILRNYAMDIGFAKDDWPPWLRRSR